MELLLFHSLFSWLCTQTPAALKGLHSSVKRPTRESTWTSLKAVLNFLNAVSHLDSCGILILQINSDQLGTICAWSTVSSNFFTLCMFELGIRHKSDLQMWENVSLCSSVTAFDFLASVIRYVTATLSWYSIPSCQSLLSLLTAAKANNM